MLPAKQSHLHWIHCVCCAPQNAASPSIRDPHGSCYPASRTPACAILHIPVVAESCRDLHGHHFHRLNRDTITGLLRSIIRSGSIHAWKALPILSLIIESCPLNHVQRCGASPSYWWTSANVADLPFFRSFSSGSVPLGRASTQLSDFKEECNSSHVDQVRSPVRWQILSIPPNSILTSFKTMIRSSSTPCLLLKKVAGSVN
jgi:hypothetical protein